MKQVVLALVALALVFALPAVAAEAEAATESQTLEGQYQWNRMEEPGDIKAVFTPTSDGQWEVSFYFNFRDEDHVYSGTANGSLTAGDLSGEVMSDGENPRPFQFEGKVVDGVFEGTHGTTGDDAQETGTIKLGSWY